MEKSKIYDNLFIVVVGRVLESPQLNEQKTSAEIFVKEEYDQFKINIIINFHKKIMQAIKK